MVDRNSLLRKILRTVSTIRTKLTSNISSFFSRDGGCYGIQSGLNDGIVKTSALFEEVPSGGTDLYYNMDTTSQI